MKIKKNDIKRDFQRKLISNFAKDVNEASMFQKYIAFGKTIREYASQKWLKTNKDYINNKKKQVYYFSVEFLTGKFLEDNLINLGIREKSKKALKEIGIKLEDLIDIEREAGLGNGGLGRLAACFLDSMASIDIPGHGNGIRYKYGLFEQKINNGYQVEVPDRWLKDKFVWEVKRSDKSVVVKFGGKVDLVQEYGKLKAIHKDYEPIMAVPYDVPIVGYGGETVNTLRLWSAEPIEDEFDFSTFSSGDYLHAVENKYSAQAISQVLYPDDSNYKGKLLRLKQQYFFVSAGIQSILRTYKKYNEPIDNLYKYVAIQINDTHPSVAIAELMRLLIDERNLSWEDAWDITTKVFAYTNHTIMAEALEVWSVDMFKKLLPRIYMIIEEINRRFCNEIFDRYNGNHNKIEKMAIIQDGNIRMAHLAIVGSHSVNGVAKLHTKILKEKELKDFHQYYPNKFNSKTNGITHRRWLLKSNSELAELITNTIGEGWIKQPNKLKFLEKYSSDCGIQEEIRRIKQKNKNKLSKYIFDKYGIKLDTNSIFDIQCKRIHAYKRQVLNIFHIMDLYNRLKENPNLDIVPRTFLFAAKASPGYYFAKQVIKLISSVANKINNDKYINDKLKVVFLENYNVSLAEKLIPSANVSEQISTASKEASGTGNMKFMMNGAITIATLDGANVEIKELVGDNNIVIFGLSSEEVMNFYENGDYFSIDVYNNDRRIQRIMKQLTDGYLNVPKQEFINIREDLITHNDQFFVFKDFDSYVKSQDKIDKLYRNKKIWDEMSIINIANSGKFSSDNTIRQYSKEIWDVL